LSFSTLDIRFNEAKIHRIKFNIGRGNIYASTWDCLQVRIYKRSTLVWILRGAGYDSGCDKENLNSNGQETLEVADRSFKESISIIGRELDGSLIDDRVQLSIHKKVISLQVAEVEEYHSLRK